MSNKAPSLSLPKGGGALSGMGEKFSADLFTGTGNFSIPISLPPGRNGMSPSLTLGYSTGSGNGPFGLGWGISTAGITRKTDKGIPKYVDDEDIFILSGAEDLVPVKKSDLVHPVTGAATGISIQYRPRTEGLFARIQHIKDSYRGNYWEVKTKDGLTSFYGSPGTLKDDPAVIADPEKRTNIFSWRLSRTEDPFGNHVLYRYLRNLSFIEPHIYDQLYLSEILYGDYGDPAAPSYLLQVKFNFEDRPDAFSTYKQGFEIRTKQRCSNIEIYTNALSLLKTKTYHFTYLDQAQPGQKQPLNLLSLLTSVQIEGHDGTLSEWMPPLDLNYSEFQPNGKKFYPVEGALPSNGLASPELELVDLNGNGLSDILEMNGSVRWYRNLGNGKFSDPVLMDLAPGGLNLGDPGVQLLDANGNGRVDLLVNRPDFSGYFPTRFASGWDQSYFQVYEQAPSFNFNDPQVRLIDLDGNGITDALRIGDQTIECFFNDPEKGFYKVTQQPLLEGIGGFSFSDPRIRMADMSGDGMQDIVMINANQVAYWPNLGYGKFGKRVIMRGGLSLPFDLDPQRLLLGDIDGDGCSDLIYIDNGNLQIWINHSGNSWSNSINIEGTPSVTNIDAIRLVDLNGTGVSGILWTGALSGESLTNFYLDFTADNKPYLLEEMDNNMGYLTRVEYKSSLYYYLEDEKKASTRWKTELPFPVQVVSRVETIDKISTGKLTTIYSYHHGYWDGIEREFRGFGRVEQTDTETFEKLNSNKNFNNISSIHVTPIQYTSPTLTKTWFHQGAIGDSVGGFYEADYNNEFWKLDPQCLKRPDEVNSFLSGLSPIDRRDALRALRGATLRTEAYAKDGSVQEDRPYTITEVVKGVREEGNNAIASLQKGHRPYKIFFPYAISERSTQWERGNDPMTQLLVQGRYDSYGQQLDSVSLGVPRKGNWKNGGGTLEPYLTTVSQKEFIYADNIQKYFVDRILYTKSWDASGNAALPALNYIDELLNSLYDSTIALPILSHSIQYYDGDEFTGLPYGEIGPYGAQIRTESLILTEDTIDAAYGLNTPPCFSGVPAPDWSTYPADFVNAMQDERLGYKYKNAALYVTGYYIQSESMKYDFQDASINTPHGLLLATKDSLGNITEVEYDNFELLPIRVTDSGGMQTTANYDYRVLQPDILTDHNENNTLASFTPLGLLYKTAMQGKTGENKGDTLDHPTSIREYDFFNYIKRGKPIFVKSSSRERHYYDDPNSPYLVQVEYSDGFGRLLQSRSQAEDLLFGNMPLGDSGLPADQSASNANAIGYERSVNDPLNVVVSGWQVYNNKGLIVEKYEPFFDRGFDYLPTALNPPGISIQLFYDPRGQLIRTLNPDGTEERIIFGIPYNTEIPTVFEPTIWVNCTYSPNDLTPNLKEFGTPKFSFLDALGRTVKTYEKNKFFNYITQQDEEQDLEMNYVYDLQGNLLQVIDQLNRILFTHIYDMGNQKIKVDHLDAGISVGLIDSSRRPIFASNGLGGMTLLAYDVLNRPTMIWGKDSASEVFTLRQVLQYGDSSGLSQPENKNLNKKIWRHYDEAGRIENSEYDFKGNSLSTKRKVIKPSELLSVFIGPPPSWNVSPYRVDWTGLNAGKLDAKEYANDLQYDALNRVTLMEYPEASSDNKRRIALLSYNKGGGLNQVNFKDDSSSTEINYVHRIAYNAKGQRLLLALGNGLMTRYVYDPLNFRLLRLKTEGYSVVTGTGTISYVPQSGTNKQDYGYTYDPLANILGINDESPNSGVGGVTGLQRTFFYDGINRLLKATGRENGPTTSDPYLDDLRSDDVNSTRAYTQMYSYDVTGNIQELNHDTAGGGSFTRTFNYTSGSINNILQSIDVGSSTYSFSNDAVGHQTAQDSSRKLLWSQNNQLIAFFVQTGTSEPSQYTQYMYAGNERVMKIVRLQGGAYKVRIYIGGVFEEYYEVNSSGVNQGYQSEIWISDDQNKIASKRIGNAYGDITPEIKYLFPDQLRSSMLLTDDIGSVISREEYYPFGETSFGSYGKKKYRYCGREKDEESGLYYYGARYYLAWTCRFVSVDPLALDYSHLSPFNYASNNPITYFDIDGMQTPSERTLPKTETKAEQDNTTVQTTLIAQTITPGCKYLSVSVSQIELYRLAFAYVYDYERFKLPANTTINFDNDFKAATEQIEFFFTHNVPAYVDAPEVAKEIHLLAVKRLFGDNEEEANRTVTGFKNTDSVRYRHDFSAIVPIITSGGYALWTRLLVTSRIAAAQSVVSAAAKIEIEVLAFDAKTTATMYSATVGSETLTITTASVVKNQGVLILNSLDIEGAKAGVIGVKNLFELARQLGRNEGVKQVIINGNIRSSGKFINTFPSQVIINVN